MIYLKGEGIPEIYCYGNNRYYNILVLELLGKSLEDWFTQCGNKFSVPTVCKLGIEMVKRAKLIHEKNHIHRDIKPDNFMTGIDENEEKIYIIDFGLAKKYRSSKTFEHIKFREYKKLTGTIRYASLNSSRYWGIG
jgi:serine/threonine protein kinase